MADPAPARPASLVRSPRHRAPRRPPSRLIEPLVTAAGDPRHAARHLPVAVLIVAYAVRFSVLSVSVHDGFGTPPYDMAIFDQGVWLLSRFHAPFVTVMGRDLFGDHTSFVLLAVVPLYWIWPHAQVLLVLQSALLAAAAIPIYLLAQRRIGSSVMATLLAATYLLNPALQNGNLEQFHPECFLVPSIAVAIYAAVEWKPRLLTVAVVASLLVKEDTVLLVVPLGVWILVRRNRRIGLTVIAVALAYSAVAYEVVIRSLLGSTSFYANRIPFGGVGGTFRTFFTAPQRFWSYTTSQGRPFYVWQMGVSVGWAFLRFPEVAAIGLLTLLENVLSTFPYMHQILYHYSLALVPVLVCGTVLAVARLRRPRYRQAATALVTVAAITACTLWGLAPFSRQTYPHMSPSDPEVAEINHVLAALPKNAVVSAYYPYVSHIDHRTRIYMWPTPWRATYWALYTQEGEQLAFADQVQYVVLPVQLTGTDETTWARIRSQFRLVVEDGGVALYVRKGA